MKWHHVRGWTLRLKESNAVHKIFEEAIRDDLYNRNLFNLVQPCILLVLTINKEQLCNVKHERCRGLKRISLFGLNDMQTSNCIGSMKQLK